MSTSFGDKCRELREKRGMTSYALAQACGVQPSTITRLEKGEREPSLEMARKIMHALGVTLAALDQKKK